MGPPGPVTGFPLPFTCITSCDENRLMNVCVCFSNRSYQVILLGKRITKTCYIEPHSSVIVHLLKLQ
jgi:hypothetical protein